MNTHPSFVVIFIVKILYLNVRICFNVENGATIKGKIMLPNIFYPLKETPVRKDNNSKDIILGKCQNLNTPICQSFKLPNFDTTNIKFFIYLSYFCCRLLTFFLKFTF